MYSRFFIIIRKTSLQILVATCSKIAWKEEHTMRRFIKIVVLVLVSSFLLNGCSMEESSNEKLRDLEFTVVSESDIPEELMKIIEEKENQ